MLPAVIGTGGCDDIQTDAKVESPPGTCFSEFVPGPSRFNPRSLLVTELGELVTLDAGSSSIVLYSDENKNLKIEESEAWTLYTASSGTGKINHGLAFYDGYIYASGSFQVLRWPFQPSVDGSHRKTLGSPEV